MKDEIKEILNDMKIIVEDNDNLFKLDLTLNKEDTKLLLDYITNLQEELEEEKRIEQEILKTIQELEEKLYNLTHTIFTGRNYNEVLKSEQDYKSRNEKAIEFIIEKCIISDVWEEQKFNKFIPVGCIKYKTLSIKNTKKLYNMLGGDE